jgi:hypothetical protein
VNAKVFVLRPGRGIACLNVLIVRFMPETPDFLAVMKNPVITVVPNAPPEGCDAAGGSGPREEVGPLLCDIAQSA